MTRYRTLRPSTPGGLLAVLVWAAAMLVTGCGGGVAAGPAAAPAGPASGRVYGYVTAAPGCPAEQAGHVCRRPLAGHVEADTLTNALVATASSDGQGRFDLTLPPRWYWLRVRSGPVVVRCHPVMVEVRADQTTRVDITCDSGIRRPASLLGGARSAK